MLEHASSSRSEVLARAPFPNKLKFRTTQTQTTQRSLAACKIPKCCWDPAQNVRECWGKERNLEFRMRTRRWIIFINNLTAFKVKSENLDIVQKPYATRFDQGKVLQGKTIPRLVVEYMEGFHLLKLLKVYLLTSTPRFRCISRDK